ncbi:MAG: thiamine pyrophosphate-binding protein, partial [Alphaproteobacteria bacterium]
QNRPQFASDAMADVLNGLGFKYAFLNPGSSYRGLHDSLVNYNRNRQPQAVLCHHEDIAVHMAQGYAKATQRSSLSILHDLVGLMHGTMGVYNAFCDRTPVVVLGGSGPSDPKLRRGIDYLHSANVQGQLVRPFVKWDDEASTAEGVLESIVRANKIASTWPKGPVYVSVDAGVQEEKLNGPIAIPDTKLSCNQAPEPPAANDAVVERCADILINAKNPVITGGRIMYRPEATKPLVQLVELIGASYVEDRNCTCMPTNHPQNLTGDSTVVGKADVILAVDSMDVTMIVDGYSSRVRGQTGAGAGRTKIIDLSLNEFAGRSWSRVGGKLAPTTEQMLGDPVIGLKQLVDAVKTKLARKRGAKAAITARINRIAKAQARMAKRQQSTLKKRWSEAPLSPHRFAHEIHEAVKRKPTLLAVRGHRAWPAGIWQFKGCGSNLGHSGGGGVGYGPGALVGAALAARDDGRYPVGILGDGDFQMAAGALWTAVHMRVPILCIINNNTSWYNDEQHQVEVAGMRGRPKENAWIATTTREPDIDPGSIARGYGCWAGDPVTDPDEFGPALKRAMAEVENGAVAVLDVRTSPR